jgi:hypothetical protein
MLGGRIEKKIKAGIEAGSAAEMAYIEEALAEAG